MKPEEILEGLNTEQERAVRFGEGPLLIVAGARTGKTMVITKRIAWLVATKKAKPEEILALTFTEKEMEGTMRKIYFLNFLLILVIVIPTIFLFLSLTKTPFSRISVSVAF